MKTILNPLSLLFLVKNKNIKIGNSGESKLSMLVIPNTLNYI